MLFLLSRLSVFFFFFFLLFFFHLDSRSYPLSSNYMKYSSSTSLSLSLIPFQIIFNSSAINVTVCFHCDCSPRNYSIKKKKNGTNEKFIKYWLSSVDSVFFIFFFFKCTKQLHAVFFTALIYNIQCYKRKMDGIIIDYFLLLFFFFFSLYVLFIRYFNVKNNCYPHQLFNNVNSQLYSSWRPRALSFHGAQTESKAA